MSATKGFRVIVMCSGNSVVRLGPHPELGVHWVDVGMTIDYVLALVRSVPIGGE